MTEFQPFDTVTIIMDPQNQPIIAPVQNKTFLQKYKLTLISLLIIILAAIPLLLLSNTASKQKIPQQVTVAPSPTTEPLTSSNAQQQLNQADSNIESTMNQVDTDLQTQSQIDTSKDSTTGL